MDDRGSEPSSTTTQRQTLTQVLRCSGHSWFFCSSHPLPLTSSYLLERSGVSMLVSHTHDTVPTASTANPGMWTRAVHSRGKNAISAHVSQSGIVCHSLRIKLCRHPFSKARFPFCYVCAYVLCSFLTSPHVSVRSLFLSFSLYVSQPGLDFLNQGIIRCLHPQMRNYQKTSSNNLI